MPLSLGKSSGFGRFKAKRGRRNRFVTRASFNDEADKKDDFNMVRVFFRGSISECHAHGSENGHL